MSYLYRCPRASGAQSGAAFGAIRLEGQGEGEEGYKQSRPAGRQGHTPSTPNQCRRRKQQSPGQPQQDTQEQVVPTAVTTRSQLHPHQSGGNQQRTNLLDPMTTLLAARCPPPRYDARVVGRDQAMVQRAEMSMAIFFWPT